MADLRVGDRVRHRVTGREGVVIDPPLVGGHSQLAAKAVVEWRPVPEGVTFVEPSYLIPVEPVPGEGERGAG